MFTGAEILLLFWVTDGRETLPAADVDRDRSAGPVPSLPPGFCAWVFTVRVTGLEKMLRTLSKANLPAETMAEA